MAERWAALAEGWPGAEGQEDAERLAGEARSLTQETGGPEGFGEALRKASPEAAGLLLDVAASTGAEELAEALGKLLARPLPAGLALRALEALGACGGRPGEDRIERFTASKEVADGLVETLEATGEPEAIAEASSPLEGLREEQAVAALLEVFVRLGPDGWLGASRLAGRSPSLDSALAEALDRADLPGPEALPLLKRLASSEVKATSKGARALIHKLKSRGVRVEEEDEPAVWSPPPPEEGPGEALVTGFDQSGHRLVWLALPAAGRGMDVGYGVVSDSEGLVSFSWGPMARKSISEVKEELLEEHAKRRIPLVAVEPEEALGRIGRAAALTESRGGKLPDEYRAFTGHHPPGAGEARDVYDFMPHEAVERARHSTSLSPSLLEDPEAGVAYWQLEEGALAQAAGPEAGERIIVAPQAPRVAEAEEASAFCDRLFTGDLFERLLGRLEEQALVLWLAGRREAASLCLSCAAPFRQDPLMKPSAHPFWRLWAEKLLEAHKTTSRREATESRLILTPDEAAAEAEEARRRLRPDRRRKG